MPHNGKSIIAGIKDVLVDIKGAFIKIVIPRCCKKKDIQVLLQLHQ
jgi:hypothetical protein